MAARLYDPKEALDLILEGNEDDFSEESIETDDEYACKQC